MRESLTHAKRGTIRLLLQRLTYIPTSMIPKSPLFLRAAENEHIARAFAGAIDLHRQGAEYADIAVRGYLLVLFSELFRVMPFVENGSCETDVMKSIIHFCHDNYDTDISLQSISDKLHISRYYISHLFNRKLHTGFNDYINSLRISRACEMLKLDPPSPRSPTR